MEEQWHSLWTRKARSVIGIALHHFMKESTITKRI